MQREIGSLGANELLELIFVYMAEVSSRRKYDEVIELLAKMGKALSGADRCSVWVVNNEKKCIYTKIAQGIDALELPIDSGIVGNSIVNGTRYIIDDVYSDPRFNSDIDKATGYKTKSMVVVPMYDYEENVIGAFQVINRIGNGGVFDERDMQRLTLATTYAAETILSAQLTQEIDETQKEVVFTMGAIGESRSKETGNHVKRVAEYSKILALAYGLDPDEAELLKQASPMHDIGKVAIPDAVLNKPGRFNEQERLVMDSHAELGFEMLKNSHRKLLQAAAIVAHQHHEKWDGTGYPQKLKGEQIHIYGRITAVADVFDALGSDRVYKKAWDDERINELFRQEQGKHFDPKLVDLFFENLNKLYAIREQFKDTYKVEQKTPDPIHTIKVLGAYGTKAKGFGTTSFALNKNVVIDAGNLLYALDEESIHVTDIWITHAHLDHIVDIAFIIDNYFDLRKETITIHATSGTIDAIKQHFLNNVVWPDFSKIQLASGKVVVDYDVLELDREYTLSDAESIKGFKTDHTNSSCGYIYTKAGRRVVITADTCNIDNVITMIENDQLISALVVECSFPTGLEELAITSKHMTPKILFEALQKLQRRDFKLYINHIKPSYLLQVAKDIEQYKGDFEPILLKDGEKIEF